MAGKGQELLLETGTITPPCGWGSTVPVLTTHLSTLPMAKEATYLALVVPKSGTWLSQALLRSQRRWVSAKLSQNMRDREAL